MVYISHNILSELYLIRIKQCVGVPYFLPHFYIINSFTVCCLSVTLLNIRVDSVDFPRVDPGLLVKS